MDPITQGAFGAVLAQSTSKSRDLGKAALIGSIAGMAPDLDVIIRSSEDSLLAIEYHRHFTHALLFIPIGGLICAAVLYPLLTRHMGISFLKTCLWCIAAVATHGLLDACTSYGTQLMLPFSNHRYAWDIISIIDPLVTVPLLIFIGFAAIKRKREYVFAALTWIIFYFGMAVYQHHRAINQAKLIAGNRELNVSHFQAKPSFGNIVVWKVITSTDEKYYVDAVKTGFGEPIVWEGDCIRKFNLQNDMPWLDPQSQQAKDIERFRWFSGGYIALDRNDPYKIIDIRYSLLPQTIHPLWGIALSPDAGLSDHVRFYTDRNDREYSAASLWDMIWFSDNQAKK